MTRKAKTTISEAVFSATGAELDPVDMQPMFAEGMSRLRWLEAHKDERAAELIEALVAPEPEIWEQEGFHMVEPEAVPE